MPLSEFHSSMKGKHDPSQPKMESCPSDLSSFAPDQEFTELLWEKGQIVMQGQSNRQKKSSFPRAFPSCSGNAQEKEDGNVVAPNSGKHGVMSSAVKDFQTTGLLGQIRLNGQDVEIAPWPNYPIDDYYSEFLSEFSGVNLNSLSTMVPADRILSYGEVTRGTHITENGKGTRDATGCSEPNGMMNSQLIQLPPQYQSSTPRSRAKESDFRTSAMPQGSNGDLHTTKMQKEDQSSSKLMQLNSSMGLTNFSHFSRPVALVKANLQSFDRVRSNEKTSTTVGTSPLESALIEPVSGLKGVSGFQGQLISVRPKADLKSSAQSLQEMLSVEHSDTVLQEDAAKNSRNRNKNHILNSRRSQDHMQCQISSFTDNVAVVKRESDKRSDTVVASPSMCSANGPAAASNDVKNRGKRKNQECEESEYQSEDLDDDSTDVKKTAPGRGTSTKRSRAAEVHNLSERRRRDRINEKMRALQELIPNCNKVDKASVLDEAIEYLKSLQMQVQIMSMGGGLCMPPMILPTGVRATHMGPFAPMGMGMGMGMGLGFGMGMLDMTGSPLIPVPPMHGPQYPCPTIPGTAGLHGMPCSNGLQVFGMPGQASPIPMPRPPVFIPLTGMSMQANPSVEAPSAEVCPVQATESAPQSSKNQLLQTIEPVAKSSAENAQANKGCIEESSVVETDNKISNVCGNEAINNGNAVSSSAMTSFDL